MSAKDQYVGPATPGAEEFESVIGLANGIFRADGRGDVRRDCPQLFGPGRRERLRIFSKDGQPVSLVGTIVNEAVLLGCSVRVACMGAVCTEQWARGQGLAGRLVDDAVERAIWAGASIMLISGHLALYSRRGSLKAGRFYRYSIPVERVGPEASLEVVGLGPKGCERGLRMFEAEPIRFRRTVEEYAGQIACGQVLDKPGRS